MIFNTKGPSPLDPSSVSISIIEEQPSLPFNLPLHSMLQAIAQGIPVGKTQDTVDHPEHYRQASGMEAIDVIEAWDLNFNLGNVLKYVCRAGVKDSSTSVEDLQKALWYLGRELDTRTKEV